MMKLLLIFGALDAALAVALGAFGAHGLKQRVKYCSSLRVQVLLTTGCRVVE